jgi:hypothetical protein
MGDNVSGVTTPMTPAPAGGAFDGGTLLKLRAAGNAAALRPVHAAVMN